LKELKEQFHVHPCIAQLVDMGLCWYGISSHMFFISLNVK